MSIADLPKREAPDSLMLTGFWYRALPSQKVKPGNLHKATLLEIPLAIGRDRGGKPFALRDACPHRGMPLSCGHFDGGQVECSYHGWRFEAQSGQCCAIPSLTADQDLKIDRIYAGNYACEEHESFVWVFIPDPGPAGAGFTARVEPEFGSPRFATFNDKFKTAYLTADLPSGMVVAQPPQHSRKAEAV
jgi:phenylpropionate dioxygenase-like ring-hydroxylating dioxygenase large terminal subunit